MALQRATATTKASGKVGGARVDSLDPSSDSNDDSSSSDEDSDSSDSDNSDDDDDDDNDEERPGFVQRIANAVQAKQHQVLEARRHPVLEWKEAARWDAENAAGKALAEAKRRRREARAAEKAAARERKEKRRAQRELNKVKEQEFLTLLQGYDEQLVRANRRNELLTAFSTDSRAREKQRLAATQVTLKAERERAAEQRLEDLQRDDQFVKACAARHLQQSIDTANEMARRSGILPAINAPSPVPQDEQDETSSLLILRVNPPGDSPPRSPLPGFQGNSAADSAAATAAVGSAGGGSRGGARPKINRVSSMTSVVPSKRTFFTANLKRFKHTEEIRGEAIGDHGGVELARSLLTGACPRVKRIYLGWNHIRFAGIAALADCFIRGACSQLQVLDLRCNSIDAKSFRELLGVLEKGGLPELLDLVLQGNIIGDEGAKAIAHAMLKGTLQALRLVDVRQNRIRNAGVQAIWNVFTAQCFKRCCPKLQLLDMRRNDASGALTRSFCPCPPYLEF